MYNLTLKQMYDLSGAVGSLRSFENDPVYNAKEIAIRRSDLYDMCQLYLVGANVAEIIHYYVTHHQELFHDAITAGRGNHYYL